MNEPRFIELLNLYVDQQLSPQEAAELEAEIQKNPVRHRTYRQYCRMQKACAQLFENERQTAPASTALSRAMADADRKIVAFPDHSSRRAIWPVGFSIGAVAAAACVAFVLVRQPDPLNPGQDGSVVATTESAPSVQAPTEAISIAKTEVKTPAVALTSSEEFTPVFTAQSLRSTAAKPEGLFISASSADKQLLDWTRDVQLKPMRKVSAGELAFDQKAETDKPLTTQFSTATSDEPVMEMNAFQFTK